MKRFHAASPRSLDMTLTKAREYADQHPHEEVEVHVTGPHTLTGAMPYVPPNVTICGESET